MGYLPAACDVAGARDGTQERMAAPRQIELHPASEEAVGLMDASGVDAAVIYRILHDVRGDSGLRRFDRDVLAQPGATHVIVMLGTNDLRNRYAKPDEEVTADQMIAGLQQMAVRAQARGIKVLGATLGGALCGRAGGGRDTGRGPGRIPH